jgi:hypothetical protein
MALHLVSDLKYSVSGLLSGVDLSNVDDVNGCLQRGAATLIQKADIPEASGIQNITLYSGVFDYLCDPRIFGTAINDIRPQGITRNPADFVLKVNQQDFDRTKNYYYPSGTMSTFQYENGVPIIRIVAPFPKQKLIIDPMNSLGTSPNNWAVGGTASNLAVDSTVFYASPASLRFTLTGVGTGTLTRTLQSSLDASTYEGVGVAFLAIQVPSGATATNLSTVSLKLGSDSTNYSLVTASTGYLGSWVAGQWVLVAFDFSGASTTGTPDWSSIQYVQASFGTLATLTNFRVGGLFMSFPTPAQILYQSAAIFLASGSTSPTTTITADTDTIILTDAAYNIYLQECALSVLQNTGAGASDATTAKINQMLDGNGSTDIGLYARYRGDNPSQEIRQTGSWYDNSLPYNGWG